MNAHLSNFLEAMVFADENGIDTARLRADAEKIVAELLIGNALAVKNFDVTEGMGDGSAAFHVGIACTIGDDSDALEDWPSLREFADKIKGEYM